MTETSNLDRIKDLLNVWAHYYKPLPDRGFPRTCSFVVERVQASRSTETMVDTIPEDIKRLNEIIEDTLHPDFKRILSLEYIDRKPQKTKAQSIGMSRSVFCTKLGDIYRTLSWRMFGQV